MLKLHRLSDTGSEYPVRCQGNYGQQEEVCACLELDPLCHGEGFVLRARKLPDRDCKELEALACVSPAYNLL